MTKYLAFLLGLLSATAALAQSPTFAPAQKYFLGPSLGEAWASPNAYTSNNLNAQVGTTYTILATDFGKVLTFANGAAIAVTLPVATTANFPDGGCFTLVTIGAGTVTVTPTTSTINAQATKDYATSAGGLICRHGANYLAY